MKKMKTKNKNIYDIQIEHLNKHIAIDNICILICYLGMFFVLGFGIIGIYLVYR